MTHFTDYPPHDEIAASKDHQSDRYPSPVVTALAEKESQETLSHSDEPRPFILSHFIEFAPVVMVLSASICLIYAISIMPHAVNMRDPTLYEKLITEIGTVRISIVYFFWLSAMGAAGALAFIGVNATKTQDDLLFDISNHRLVMLNTFLGCLFSVVLMVPFGIDCFVDFCYYFATSSHISREGGTPEESVTQTMLMVIAPFLVGFNQSLVTMILKRLSVSVQVLFGQMSEGAALTPAPTKPSR